MPRATLIAVLSGVASLGAAGYGGYVVYNSHTVDTYGPLVYAQDVIDGDTFTLTTGEKIRLSDIDAPERTDCYGAESTDALRKIVDGLPLQLEKDITGVDHFGRLMRFVTAVHEHPKDDNAFVNLRMVEDGFARYMPSENDNHDEQLQEAEAHAQATFAGMWGACDVSAEVEGRFSKDSTPPPSKKCTVKGNIDAYGKKRSFPDHCPNYERIKITPGTDERYFCSVQEAEKAGFPESESCL